MNDKYNIYKGRYKEFIESKLLERPLNEKFEHSECHHIIPRCLGGTWDDGYVYLTYREHFIAHSILVEENPNVYKLVYALMRMANDNEHCTPDEYDTVRRLYIDSIKGENHPMYGKHLSEDTKRKLSKIHKGRAPSSRTIESLRERSIGNTYYAGKSHSDSWKRDCSRWMKGRKQVLGRSWINKDGISKMVNPTDVPNFISEGWSLGRGPVHKDSSKELIREKSSSRFWINNGNVTKFVTIEEYNNLDSNIWMKGRRLCGSNSR